MMSSASCSATGRLAGSSAAPFRKETPSATSHVSPSTHSGPAKPRTPEPGPNRRSKISPVSSNTIADNPSGAGGRMYGTKLSTVTSVGNGMPFEKLTEVLGDFQALNAVPTSATACALLKGPRVPRSGFHGMFVPPFGQRNGSPGLHAAIGPGAYAAGAPTARESGLKNPMKE